MGSATDTFHELVGELDYPMFIATAATGTERAGCLVGFATQCSIDPARFLVCLSDKNRTFEVASRSDLLVVHCVPADATELVELFGSETGHETDKFSRCRWKPGPRGTPVLTECTNWFAGDVVERMPAGDHTAFVLSPCEAQKATSEVEFPFHRAKRFPPGQEA